MGPHSTVRPVVQQKVKREQPKAKGGHPQGVPSMTDSQRLGHKLRQRC